MRGTRPASRESVSTEGRGGEERFFCDEPQAGILGMHPSGPALVSDSAKRMDPAQRIGDGYEPKAEATPGCTRSAVARGKVTVISAPLPSLLWA